MRVALQVTCINDALFPDTGRAVVTLLRRLGVEVDFPAAQTCCGQPMVNTGYVAEAVPAVRAFVDAFASYDAIVTPSGSCAGSARHQHRIVAERSGDPGLVRAVAETSPKVYELTEFLVDVLGLTDVGASFPHTVTYHPTCHSLRMLGVGDRPRLLLEQVRGLRLVDLPRATECCGFGGTFAMKNADTSIAMGSDKARHVREHGCRGAGGGGQLLPDARRRAAVAATVGGPGHAPGRGARRPGGSRMSGTFVGMPAFPTAARAALADTQLRHNLAHATGTIRDKRARVVAEVADWEDLRTAGAAIKDRTLHDLASYLLQLEESMTRAGATVHWARDAAEANAVVARSRRPTASTRWSRSSRWPRRRSASTRRWRRRGSRPGRPTWRS